MSVLPSPELSRRALLGGALAAGLGAAGLLGAGGAQAASGLQLLSSSRWSARDITATVSSTALSRQARVRILLPTGYDDDPSLRYPVLYLLHGSNGDADIWLSDGTVRQATADKKLIVVCPDGGHGGWYSNHTYSSLAPLLWETFHVDQLVPAVDANLRTLTGPGARAVAGFSAGAYGAAMYAGRHPGMFGAVSCYSGPLDSFDMQWRNEMYSEPTLDGEAPGAIYGTTPGNERVADLVDRNPCTYAAALANHRVRLYAGDTDGYEANMRRSTYVFRDALVRAGAIDLDGGLIAGGQHDGACADAAFTRDLPSLAAWLPAPSRG